MLYVNFSQARLTHVKRPYPAHASANPVFSSKSSLCSFCQNPDRTLSQTTRLINGGEHNNVVKWSAEIPLHKSCALSKLHDSKVKASTPHQDRFQGGG
mmetsp:Transcript_86865/g.127057  ORF Transcript_86865/g.127057 Transcript_86865/m.127057 type:complete len:98 (-) Transcript_86865:66-359(-)